MRRERLDSKVGPTAWHRRSVPYLASSLALLIAIAAVIIAFLWEPTNDLEKETGKILLQFALVVVLGGIIALAFNIARDDHEEKLRHEAEARENWERSLSYEVDELCELLSQIDGAYQEVQYQRHRLRVLSGSDGEGAIGARPYDRSIDRLSKVRCRFETLEQTALLYQQEGFLSEDVLRESAASLDGTVVVHHEPTAESIQECLVRLEQYLVRLQEEQERPRQQVEEIAPTSADFCALRRFIQVGDGMASSYEQDFVAPYRQLRCLIKSSLLRLHRERASVVKDSL